MGKNVVNYLYYIKKRLTGQKGFLLNICVSSLALALLCIAVTMPQILRHGEKMIRDSLADDISKYGVVRNGRAQVNADTTDYISDIYNAPEIDSVGTWFYGAFAHLTTVGSEKNYWNDILEIQNSHVREFDEDPGSVQIVYMAGQAFRINRLELYRGNADQVGTNDGYLLYLGYHFKDIPVGTVFVNEANGISYVVAGILQKNTSIVDEQALLWNLGGLKLSCSVAMDNMVLVIAPYSDNYYSADFFFKCSDDYTYEEAARKIKTISDQYGISAETGTLQDRVDAALSDIDWLINAIARLSGILFFSACIMLMTTQLLTILFRKDELGVWLISGMDQKTLFRILLGENLAKMSLSLLISFGIVLLFETIAGVSADLSGSVIYELRYILWGFVPVVLLLGALITALLCSIVTIVYVRGKSIPEIVRGTWD